MTIAENIRVPGSYNEIDTSGANSALPAYRQPILVVAPRIKLPAAWIATTAYALGATVRPMANQDNVYICVVGGTSGATQPTWPGAGGSVTDGTVTWRELTSAKSLQAVNTPVSCFSPDDGAKYAGSGSLAHRIVSAVLKHFKYAEVSLITVDDDAGSVCATASIAVAGTATKAGTIDLMYGKEKLSYSYASGATAASIATALDALIAAYHDLPYTPSVSTTTVTLRAKNGGTVGNTLGKWDATSSTYKPYIIKTDADGITLTITGWESGATDPSLDTAFAAAQTSYYAIVLSPFTGSAQIDSVKNYLTSMADDHNCKGARAWFGATQSIANSVTLAAVNNARIHFPFLRKCKTPPFEVAAYVAADHAAIGHPAIPLNNRELPYLDAPDIADRLEWGEINSLLWNGVTPLNADQSNAVRIVRSITSYTKNDAGSPDPLFLDTTKIAILDYTRQAVKERQVKEFGSGKILRDNHEDGEPAFVVTPQDIRSVNIDVALRLEKTGCLQNVKKLKDSFVSTSDANIAGRVNSTIPAETVEGLHVLANTISVTTTI